MSYIAEGPAFRSKVAVLTHDERIINMTLQMCSVPREDWLNSDGAPLDRFIEAARAEFKNRGGDSMFIAAPAYAIVRLFRIASAGSWYMAKNAPWWNE